MTKFAFESGVLQEPAIIFGGYQRHVDPKAGLALYGPYTQDDAKGGLSQSSIIVGIVGPANLVADAEQWIAACGQKLPGPGTNPFQSPSFPGFGASTFRSTLVAGKAWQQAFRAVDLERALVTRNSSARVKAVAELYADAIGVLRERDRSPQVVVCCISNEIYKQCHVSRADKARVRGTVQRPRQIHEDQLALFDAPDLAETAESTSFDLWNAIKVRAMAHAIPTQLMLEGSLAVAGPPRGVQDVATRAWNFAVAMYHKAGGSPWRIGEIDKGVCFVGISFFRDRTGRDGRMQTSVAQAFTSGGDGYVLRGQPFVWEKTREHERSPHMDEASSALLVRAVLDQYKRQHGNQLPSRLVIHKSSVFWADELRGFTAGAADVPTHDFVAFRSRGLQLYRPGDYPPLRGTYVKFDPTNLLLYTRGYVPYLGTYPGPRSPQPLEIAEHYGDSSWRTVVAEILALTKMNWNSADFASGTPITIAFSRRVGAMLAEMSASDTMRPEYRFYM